MVALKILPTAMAAEPQFEARFRREAQLVARLSAPHIIPIHDFGEIEGRLFLDMRLVRGVDLATVLESGPLAPAPRRRDDLAGGQRAGRGARRRSGAPRRQAVQRALRGDPRERGPTRRADFVYLVDFGIARRQATEGPR